MPLLWSGVGALRRDLRATETEPRESGGGTRDSEGERGKSRNAMWAGRRRENRRGREWRELGRTGRKEGEGRGSKLEETEEEAEENVTEPFGGKTQTEAEYYPEEIRVEGGGERTWKRCEERSGETDGNRTQGRGRNGKEAEGNTSGRGRRDPWRKLYRTVERTGRKEGEGSGEREGGGNAPGERR